MIWRCLAGVCCMCRQFERQYIFVAATLPSEGKKSTASSLQKMFPDLVWLAGRRLHQGLSTVAWTWRETTQDTWRSALQVALDLDHLLSGSYVLGMMGCLTEPHTLRALGNLDCQGSHSSSVHGSGPSHPVCTSRAQPLHPRPLLSAHLVMSVPALSYMHRHCIAQVSSACYANPT